VNSRIDGIIALLGQGITHRGVYYEEHAKVRDCAVKLEQRVAREFEVAPELDLFLGAVEGRLIHEGQILLGASIAGLKITSLLERLGSGGFRFLKGVSAEQIAALFGIAVEFDEPIEGGLAVSRKLLRERGIDRIELSPRHMEDGWFGESRKPAEPKVVPGELGSKALVGVYQALFSVVEEAHARAHGGSPPNLDGAREASDRFLAAAERGATDLLQLVRYTSPDSYLIGHSVRVGVLSMLLGRHLGLPRQRIVQIGAAGLLHDIGKSQVPDEILFKPGCLDPEETRAMRVHSEVGAKILMSGEERDPLVVCAAWGHHLRHDLNGYPKVSGWVSQGDGTALIQTCDAFEALTAVRPYKPALPVSRAYKIMIADVGAFHPGALRGLIRTLGLFPPGGHVLLSDGTRAEVLGTGMRVDRPLLRRWGDADGRSLPPADVRKIDLASERYDDLSIVGPLSV